MEHSRVVTGLARLKAGLEQVQPEQPTDDVLPDSFRLARQTVAATQQMLDEIPPGQLQLQQGKDMKTDDPASVAWKELMKAATELAMPLTDSEIIRVVVNPILEGGSGDSSR